jgi:hypothetical protein
LSFSFVLTWLGVVASLIDTFIQKTRKLYLDTRTQRNLAKLNDDLYEVQQIMTRNVQEVLGVGEKLDRKCLLSECLKCFYLCQWHGANFVLSVWIGGEGDETGQRSSHLQTLKQTHLNV